MAVWVIEKYKRPAMRNMEKRSQLGVLLLAAPVVRWLFIHTQIRGGAG